MNQHHLQYKDKINLGAFYTPPEYVEIAWNLIKPFLSKESIVLDSSCGYGNFFMSDIDCRKKANDFDKIAADKTKINFPNIEVFNKNALLNINREEFKIDKNDKLIIIGNPPYNDTTSIIRSDIKKDNIKIDDDVRTRDYGISFLLSYAKLKADVVCVLHPLSYLIKKSNFNLLRNFSSCYKLIDGILIDSSTFKETSKGISFPIIIALYSKDKEGMDYEYIRNFNFETIDKKCFKLKEFDFIPNYINKYPLKNVLPKKDDILFWTMRDINALKRNQTFVKDFGYNAIIVDKNKLDYYVYVDVFKQFSHLMPYYFGNLDVFINNNKFQKYKNYFVQECLTRNSFLKKYINTRDDISVSESKEKIQEYFKILIDNHYVYKS
ncbi:MAG: SAM-dependent methyltransferase [Alphaproteobacteria bacterium]|jgi:hypothetical protein